MRRTLGISTQSPTEAPRELSAAPAVGYLPLALITALGAFLRVYHLDHQSFWMDEVLTILSSHASFDRILFDPPVDPNIPPLYYLLLRALKGLGDGEIALRFPSVLAGVLSIPVMYSVALRWLTPAALLAAFLLAVSPLHVWYSQEARPYALLILLALLAVRFLQLSRASPRSLRNRIGFVVSSVAAFYVHTVAVAFIAALAIYVLLVVPRPERRSWLATFAAVALISVPGVYLLLRIPPTVSANPFYLFSPTHVGYTLWTFATGYSLGPNLVELRTEGVSVVRRNLFLILPVMGLYATLLAFGLGQVWRSRRDAATALVLWMTVPIAFVILGAWLTSHPYNVRYTLLALPPTLMLLASGIHWFRVRSLRIGSATLLVTCSAAALWNYYTDPRYYREDNRGAAAFIQAGSEPDELVIASAAYTTVPLDHYLGRTPIKLVGYPTVATAGAPDRRRSLGAMFVQAERVDEDFRRLLGIRRTFWLFLSRTFHSDPEGHLRSYTDRHYRRIAEYSGPGVEAIRYERPGPGALTVP